MAEKTITADPSVRKFLFAAFPAEAFAFAAVLLAADAKTGIVTAVLLFVTALIGAALYGRKSAGANVLRVALAVIYMAAFCGVQFGLNGYSYQGHFTAIACALLACLSFLGNAPEPVTDAEAGAAEGGAEGASADGTSGAAFLSANRGGMFRETACASVLAAVLLAACGIVRELLGAGTLFGVTVTGSAVVSSFYGKTAIGLICAGFLLAVVAAARKADFSGRGTMFVLIPTAILLMVDARGIGGIAKQVFILIILLAGLFSIRKRLMFSDTGRPFRGMPIELIMACILYMVLSWL